MRRHDRLLKEMKFGLAVKKLQDGIEETLIYVAFLTQHWFRIQPNGLKNFE